MLSDKDQPYFMNTKIPILPVCDNYLKSTYLVEMYLLVFLRYPLCFNYFMKVIKSIIRLMRSKECVLEFSIIIFRM